jgi:hypothetical protein
MSTGQLIAITGTIAIITDRQGRFRPGWHDSDGVPLALEAFPWSVT